MHHLVLAGRGTPTTKTMRRDDDVTTAVQFTKKCSNTWQFTSQNLYNSIKLSMHNIILAAAVLVAAAVPVYMM